MLGVRDASDAIDLHEPPRRRSARTITIDGMREKYPGANDAKERGDCFQHDNDPKAQRVGPNGTAPYTVKGIQRQAILSKLDDDSMQHAASGRDDWARSIDAFWAIS
jgi:hypothetical protein